jgi:hypothetical protein
MDQEKRSKLIRSYLKIEPITHGQLYGYQIAIPPGESPKVEDDRYGAIAASLQQHQTNVIPVIVRPTTAYNDEQEYEAIYGADWLIVAEELNIERLWVWVFNLTDDQVSAFQNEMQQLMTGTGVFQENLPTVTPVTPVKNQENLLETSPVLPVINFDDSGIKQMIQLSLTEINSMKNEINSLKNQVSSFENKLDQILAAIKPSQISAPTTETLDTSKPVTTGHDNYEKMTITQLKDICKKLKISGYSTINGKNKNNFILAIRQKQGN